MAKRFEYNFTMESQFEELKERNSELQEQNNLLKQSLQELIKVNTQLTQSIEELNNNGVQNYNQNNNEDLQSKFEMLINQNQSLREQLQNEIVKNKSTKKSVIHDDNQTENLVNVLQQLIESFKNIEIKYETEIRQLQQEIKKNKKDFAETLKRIEQEFNNKINTVEALSIQLKRKDEALESITSKLNFVQKESKSLSNGQKHQKTSENRNETVKLQDRIKEINKLLQNKEKVIKMYETLIMNLKGKITEKY